MNNGTIYSLSHKRYIGYKSKGGYLRVNKPKEFHKLYSAVHQYIWMVANGCEIPEGYDIHHIDGNKLNNSINNLELIEHSIHMSEHNKNKEKKVLQFTFDGKLVKMWDSVKDCAKEQYNKTCISDCCRGRKKTHKGYIWKYYNENGE